MDNVSTLYNIDKQFSPAKLTADVAAGCFISHRENYKGKFGDARLDKRAGDISSMLHFNQSSSIHGITRNEAEQRATYRFLSNDNVTEKILIDTVCEKSGILCVDKDILCITDTTELNFENHRNRLKSGTGIGLTGNNKDLGFFMHSSLVLDSDAEIILGISDIQLWARPEDKKSKKGFDNKTIPIEEKESNKWLTAGRASKKQLSAARSITMIEDREGDIYEQFALIPDHQTHLIIRNRANRKLSTGQWLFNCLSGQPPAGRYDIDLVHDIDNRKGIEKRIAEVEVRYCKVSIKKPADHVKKDLVANVEVNAVEVKEMTSGIKRPILWRILTTHKVENYEDAVKIINKYRLRWYIEQLHRLIKKKGFAIESSELESGWALRKLTVMILNSSLRVMQLLLAFDNKESQPIEQVFDEPEIECLKKLNNKYEGATEKLKNKNDPQTLAWAVWVIAKLGGWKDTNKRRPPGPITLKRGLDKFNDIHMGWKLAVEDT